MMVYKANLTDCLIIKGHYSAVTIAVLGYLSQELSQNSAAPAEGMQTNLILSSVVVLDNVVELQLMSQVKPRFVVWHLQDNSNWMICMSLYFSCQKVRSIAIITKRED